MSNLITTLSALICPHGGTVSIISSNARAKAGAALVRASDNFTIAGCAFNVSGVLHPCVTVRWISTALRCKAGGDVCLTTASAGLCLAADQAPQGSVLIQVTQPKASAQ